MEEGDEEDEEDLGEEVPQETLKQCLDKFGSPDFIMEPEIFSQLKKYFQSGGNPEQVFHLFIFYLRRKLCSALIILHWRVYAAEAMEKSLVI